jgi:hypothetical protein
VTVLVREMAVRPLLFDKETHFLRMSLISVGLKGRLDPYNNLNLCFNGQIAVERSQLLVIVNIHLQRLLCGTLSIKIYNHVLNGSILVHREIAHQGRLII